jgi:hypothetical protein
MLSEIELNGIKIIHAEDKNQEREDLTIQKYE